MNNKIIIVGAGIAGSLLAITLKKIGFNVAIYEAREKEDSGGGVFLGLTPNGLNVLKNYVLIDSLKQDYTKASMAFYNSRGKKIGDFLTDYQKAQFGEETIQVKRSELYHLVNRKLENEGIQIHYGHKLFFIKEYESTVLAKFENGVNDHGDFLFGCDGAFSVVRRILYPDYAKPLYTKNISTGGFVKLKGMEQPTNGINMTFGQKGFFAYAVSNMGEVWWFNNYHRIIEPTREEIRNQLQFEIKSYLTSLHQYDDPLFNKIINATENVITNPVYDLPSLEKWYTSRCCLLGDAAHAIAPHVGQGASLAMEDAQCLAFCIANEATMKQAFERFQLMRQDRVNKIIKQARKVGNSKSTPNPVATWFRDRLLRYFIKAQIKQTNWIYGFRAPA